MIQAKPTITQKSDNVSTQWRYNITHIFHAIRPVASCMATFSKSNFESTYRLRIGRKGERIFESEQNQLAKGKQTWKKKGRKKNAPTKAN